MMAHSGRRPGWGRDYGPNYNLPKQVSADPFKNAPTPKPETQPLAEQVAPTQLPTAPPHYNQNRTVKSPTKAKEVTPTDEYEKVTAVAEDAAKIIDPVPGGVPLFDGETCKDVCTSCEIARAELPATESCTCWGVCLKGPEGHICPKDDQGYTHEHTTKPDQEWNGFCSSIKTGDRLCADCVADTLKYEIGNCTLVDNQAVCLYDLRVKYQSSSQPSFCTQAHKGVKASECLEIAKASREFNKGNGWNCFDTMDKCNSFRHKKKNDGDEINIE